MRRTHQTYALLLALLACSQAKTMSSDSANAQASGARVTSSAPSAAAGRRAGERATILFIGTSLTVGLGLDPDSAYPQQIQRMIDSAGLGYQVVNAGVSGETSSDLLGRLDWLLRQPFAVAVIETGANDGL